MRMIVVTVLLAWSCVAWAAADFLKPYSPPCVERENVFEFTQKPAVKNLGNDRYKITFAVKGNCDVAVGIVDPDGKVVRHLGSGVLGANAPAPFQKNSFKQTIMWNGKDDLDWYVKDPGKLRVRVMLGLRPMFDKRLGDTNPKNLPGYVAGIAASEEGVFLFVKGHGSHGGVTVRKFDHDGKYVAEVFPPRGDRPLEKYQGMGFVEYEEGKKALHGRNLEDSVAGDSHLFPAMNGKALADIQPVLVGKRLFFTNEGVGRLSPTSLLHYIYTDGTTDEKGIAGRLFAAIGGKHRSHNFPRLAVSPDGGRIYIANLTGEGDNNGENPEPVVLVCATEGNETTTVFSGGPGKPGTGNDQFYTPSGIDCDAAGRVYVADRNNNRVQVFSAEAKFLKSIPLDRPKSVLTPKKSGGIYVIHAVRRSGKSISCLTKLSSFENPVEEYHVDGFNAAVWAMDTGSQKPRLWAAGTETGRSGLAIYAQRGVRIYEEDGKALRLLEDFEQTHKRDGGESWFGGWSGFGPMGRAECDPVRGHVYYKEQEDSGSATRLVFDLKTGAYLGEVLFHGATDDIAFDKRGYLHAHNSAGFNFPGVVRCDPAQFGPYGGAIYERAGGRRALPVRVYKEVPYDYGVEQELGQQNSEWLRLLGGTKWLGILPVKDQPGGKFFQDGIGVNMRGDVAENCNVSYVPRMGDADSDRIGASSGDRQLQTGGKMDAYSANLRRMLEREKQGEEIYSIRHLPGYPLTGATIWTFDRTGEVRAECAAIVGGVINGVQMDEDGALYFAASCSRLYGGKPFLTGCAGIIGSAARRPAPFTGTFFKTRERDVRFLSDPAEVPMEQKPRRPPDVGGGYVAGTGSTWVDGAEWIFAGASPVKAGGCSCPTQRSHLDWYKRSFVPEQYRHSFAVLDAGGNLIMHLGRYGNIDECPGTTGNREDITMVAGRFIGGTDDYLVFPDRGERITVLKINYHAEETVEIGGK